MKVGVLGTGVVGHTIGTALVHHGHDVMMGSRTPDNETAAAWADHHQGGRASHGTFADASDFADYVFNCTAGQVTLDVLAAAGAKRLAGKVLIDVSNPLDFSGGFPPFLTVSNTDSVGEQVQRAFPDTLVVKTLNTVTASVMVDPASLAEPTDMFLAGDDGDAKTVARGFLEQFGWQPERIRDLGGIESARGLEAMLLLWVRLMPALGGPAFNVRLVGPA
jgi:predicted dinucleotide-binding enzyme